MGPYRGELGGDHHSPQYGEESAFRFEPLNRPTIDTTATASRTSQLPCAIPQVLADTDSIRT
jgi:hypothetical protein